MANYCRIILMGDPACFRIKAGANPHTRNRWGLRKTVDTDLARRQWDIAAQTFRDHGLRVEVIGAVEDCPGLVFPANAGFLLEKDQRVALSQKHFYLSHLLRARSAEKELYRKALSDLGLTVQELTPNIRFEGEADFFPAAEGFVLTYGNLIRPHWSTAMAWPPYRRVYGFRTDKAILEPLRALVPGRKILALELSQEAYYHGDTVLCAIGRKRDILLVHAQGLTPASLARLKTDFTGRLLILGDRDAMRFAANSFYVDNGREELLFCPDGLSDELFDELQRANIRPVPLDVSEFFTKGGGSVKCMICDLGPGC